MNLTKVRSTWILLWLGCALGFLALGSLPGDFEAALFGPEALCGPWG
jgi:hypothetical protein